MVVCTLEIPYNEIPCNKALLLQAVTVPHNEQTIDPSSPTTMEWSALEFETVINELDGFYQKLIRK